MSDFKNLIFLDTETTGLEEKDRIFQVAFSLNKEEFSELFLPPVPISVGASETTHYTNEDVKNKEPFEKSKMKKDLEKILSKKETILVAHNAKFDINMLEKEGLKIKNFIDTYKMAMFLDKNAKLESYRLQHLRYILNLDIKKEEVQAHDALGDVKILVLLFERLYKKMFESLKDEKKVLKKMMEVSQNPILMKKFPFGKHKGKLVSEVFEKDKGYLKWLLREKEKNNEEDDWTYTLKKYLK